MSNIIDIEKISNDESNRILTIKDVFDHIYKRAITHQDSVCGYLQPPEVRRLQCSKCHHLGMECVKGDKCSLGSNGKCISFLEYRS